MFKQLTNIESSFKHIKWFSLALVLGSVIVSTYALYESHSTVRRIQGKVYVIAGDKFMQAVAAERVENLPIEIRAHVRNFHQAFFGLEPDDAIIKRNITKALYLADISAKQEYDNLVESGYYSDVISGNISQRVLEPDSILVNIAVEPYFFRYFGKMQIIRATSISTRSIVTEGHIRMSKISDNNEHGMLIERWKVLANRDLFIEKR
jgi:conjugative transposon TraK protein